MVRWTKCRALTPAVRERCSPPAIDLHGNGALAPVLARLRILVIDDNVDGADMLAVLLETCGRDARVVYDPIDALQIAAEFRPGVAFVDLGLPGMDGFELAKVLRATPGLASIRLIAMTGWRGQRSRSLEAGFAARLLKPAKLEKIKASLVPTDS